MFKSLAAAALLGMASTHRLAVSDVSDVLGRNVDHYTHKDTHISGYNGADKDEINDNKFYDTILTCITTLECKHYYYSNLPEVHSVFHNTL